MNILVIDAKGGGMGKQLVANIKQSFPKTTVMAVGTNAAATQAMNKAGADISGTGENSVAVACKKADIIVGPVGIVIADSMLGEVTPKMAAAVGTAVSTGRAKLVLIPFNHCESVVVGVKSQTPAELIEEAMEVIGRMIG